jgi:alginate O-acetyltransferase complex protein AlgI
VVDLLALTFHLICVGWLLFRAQSMDQVWGMLSLIFTDFRVTDFSRYAGALLAFYGLPVAIFELWLYRRGDLASLTKVAWPVRAAVYAYVAVMILIFHPTETHEFIYFQF